MRLSAFLPIGLLATEAVAHGPELTSSLTKRYSTLSKRCAASVASLKQKRYAKRSQYKRDLDAQQNPGVVATETPYYDVIQNDTCVLTPDVMAGPYYWPRSQTLRQDMTEDQVGVPLILDIGVLDMATCEPLPDALVSLWHCNGTGSYSSFTGHSPNTPFLELLQSLNVSESDFKIGETDLHTDDTTWLRGMWPSDESGLLEMKSIFPGFYIERTIHIHVQVFTDYTLNENGTISTGDTHSIGQIYFDEETSQKIMSTEPYVSHTQINRTTNAVDSLFSASTENGFNPQIDVVPLDGVDVRNGVVGYITLGIDTENTPSLDGSS